MDPAMHASAVWPAGQDYLRPIVATAYLLVVGLLAVLLTRRWGSWHYMKRLPLIQLLVVVLLGGSLAFVFISAIIVLGVGSSYSEAACNGGIWLCILLYASSKGVLYYLLLEKLQRVHSHTVTGRIGRFQSWWYRGGVVLFVAWLGVAAVMIAGRLSLIRQHDGACVIGLRLYATVPMLVVDALTNIYLTTGFVLPVWRSQNEKARRLAKMSSIAAIAALFTSFANILILSLMHGHQLSVICLGSCGLDVAFNSVIVYLVTTARHSGDDRTTTGGSTDLRGMEQGGASRGMGMRSARSAGYYPSTHGAGFGSASGVHVVEEVRVEEDLDDSPPLVSSRRMSAMRTVAPLGRVDLDLDDDDASDLTLVGARRLSGARGLPTMHTVSFQTPETMTPMSEIDEEKATEKP